MTDQDNALALIQCIHMTAEMAANCPTCNPSALRGLPTGEVTPQRWQPIETAPKDGSWILLYECEGVYDTPDFTHWIASWRWTEDSCGWLDQDENIVVSNPSHWMPLPFAPQEGVGSCPGYSPGIQAMGDCRHCGHTVQAHDHPATPQQGRSLPDRVMVWHSSPTIDHLGTWATTRYPDDAVAYVPEAVEMQPSVLDETSPRAAIREIGNQMHNLACELQDNEDLAERLETFACELWRVAQSASSEPIPFPTPQEAAKVLLAMGPTDRYKAWKATRDAPGMFGTWLHAALRAIASEDSK